MPGLKWRKRSTEHFFSMSSISKHHLIKWDISAATLLHNALTIRTIKRRSPVILPAAQMGWAEFCVECLINCATSPSHWPSQLDTLGLDTLDTLDTGPVNSKHSDTTRPPSTGLTGTHWPKNAIWKLKKLKGEMYAWVHNLKTRTQHLSQECSDNCWESGARYCLLAADSFLDLV